VRAVLGAGRDLPLVLPRPPILRRAGSARGTEWEPPRLESAAPAEWARPSRSRRSPAWVSASS